MTLLITLLALQCIYIDSKFRACLKTYTKGTDKVTPRCIVLTEGQKIVDVHLLAVSFTEVSIILTLIIFQCMA